MCARACLFVSSIGVKARITHPCDHTVQAPLLYTILRQSKHGRKGMIKTFAGIPVSEHVHPRAPLPRTNHLCPRAQMFERHPPYGPIYRFVIR